MKLSKLILIILVGSASSRERKNDRRLRRNLSHTKEFKCGNGSGFYACDEYNDEGIFYREWPCAACTFPENHGIECKYGAVGSFSTFCSACSNATVNSSAVGTSPASTSYD